MWFVKAPSAQELKPPGKSGRFNVKNALGYDTAIRERLRNAALRPKDARMKAVYTSYRGQSFAHILDINRGAGRGFDLLRLLLAIAILLSHSSSIVGTNGVANQILNWLFQIPPETAARIAIATKSTDFGEARQLTGIARPLTLSYLPMFFALSGFLVTGSALRTHKLLPFLGLRALRLLPALVVEVLLSALILGIVFTKLPLGDYFTHPQFWTYFLNILGHPQYLLPGVFRENVRPIVNGNLWTLPWELYCYAVMSTAIVSGLIFNRKLATVLYSIVSLTFLFACFAYGFEVRPAHLGGPTLIYYFLTGMMLYLWRDKLIFHEGIFLACAVTCYAFMMSPNMVFIYPILLTYVTVFIGLFPFPRSKLISSGDYSYGIYLYGYPVTQAIIAAVPSLKGNLVVVAPTALILTTAFAALSWHGVEKHFLKLKRFIAPRSANLTERLHPMAFEQGDALGMPPTHANPH